MLFVWINESKTPRFVSANGELFGFNSENKFSKFKDQFKSNSDEFGQYSRQDLHDELGRLYQLHLGTPTHHDDIIVYAPGTWTPPKEDGWLRIEIAKAISTCSLPKHDADIFFDETKNIIQPPHSLKHPDYFQTKAPLQRTAQLTVTQDLPEVIAPIPVAYTTPIPVEQTLIVEQILTPTPYAVQIGSFRKEEKAFIHLEQLRRKAPHIESYQTEIQPTTLKNGKAFYRLRLANLENRPMAIKLCHQLKNDGIECFVP